MNLIIVNNDINKNVIYNLDNYEKICPADNVFIPDIKYAIIGYIKGVPYVLFEVKTEQLLYKAFSFIMGAYERNDKYILINADRLKNDDYYDSVF